MAKSQATETLEKLATPEATPNAYFDKFKHQVSTGDVVGFYDVEKQGRMSIIPRGFKLLDNDADDSKSTVLLVCELTAPMGAEVTPKKNEPPIHAKKGELVGIWGKVGMRAIGELGGVECLISCEGEKDIGRPKPMKLFSVKTLVEGAKGVPLLLISDSRRTSAGAKTFLTSGTSGSNLDADELPFK